MEKLTHQGCCKDSGIFKQTEVVATEDASKEEELLQN